jgi:aspartyl-tRNA synthetase
MAGSAVASSEGIIASLTITSVLTTSKGGSTALGRLRLRLSELAQAHGGLSINYTTIDKKFSRYPGDFKPPEIPHFLWITEFPLFTRSDVAQGRWNSSHHPFTAPMWQDIEAMYGSRVEFVRVIGSAAKLVTYLIIFRFVGSITISY